MVTDMPEVEQLLGEAKEYFDNEKYELAIENYTKIIELRGKEDAEDYGSRGTLYFLINNYEASIEDLSKAIELRENADDYFYRGNSYIGIDNYKYAIKDLTKAIELRDAEDAEDYSNRGVSYYKNCNYDVAIKDFTKVIELRDKEDAGDYHWRGISYFNNYKYEDAIKDFTKVIELRDKEDAWDYYWRGKAYYGNNNYSEAIKDYTKAIELENEEKADGYYFRGKAYYKNNNYSEAIKDYTKAIELRYEEDAEDYSWRGWAYKMKDNYDAAIKDFTKAIELRDAEDAEDYYYRGKAYYFKGDYEAAMEDAEKALELDPSHIDALQLKKDINSNPDSKIRKTLPEDPKERKVIVLLKEDDIINSSDSEWINSSKITVLKYPFDRNSPVYKNELYKSLDDAGLIEKGAILVQSPYDVDVYRDAKDIENLIHFNALRKYSIFSGFCRKLGATRISIKDFANEQINANRGRGGQAEYKIFGGEANASEELENKLRQELDMEDTYPGDSNPNIEEAKKYLEDNRIWHDEVLKSLLEARTGSGKIQSKDISFSLTSESMQALKLLGGIKLAFFNANGNYENKVSTLRDLKVSLSVEFGKG